MHYLKNEISTGYAVNAAFMNYVENEMAIDILQNNQECKMFREKYTNAYEALEEKLGSSFLIVEELINNLRAMHNLESELFYRIGIRDGVSYASGDFVFQNIGGAE